MNACIFRGLAATALALVPAFACAQNVRYEWQGKAYVDAENQMIAERVVNGVIGTAAAFITLTLSASTPPNPGKIALMGAYVAGAYAIVGFLLTFVLPEPKSDIGVD